MWKKKQIVRKKEEELDNTVSSRWHIPCRFFDFLTENNENFKKNAQLGLKSVNIKFSEQEIQFDPGFTPLSCEITKIEKAPNWA